MNNSSEQPNLKQQPQSISNPNRKNSIIETSLRKQKQYYDRLRGDRTQTKQMNIHYKTLIEKQLKRFMIADQVQGNDRNVIRQYKNMKANFQATKYLYEQISQNTKSLCKQYSKCTDMVKDILKSDRMFINNKIIFIKYLKKVQTGVEEPNSSWKQEYFKNKGKKSKKSEQAKTSTSVDGAQLQNQEQIIRNFAVSNNLTINGSNSDNNSTNIHNLQAFGPTIFTTGIIYPFNQADGLLINQFK